MVRTGIPTPQRRATPPPPTSTNLLPLRPRGRRQQRQQKDGVGVDGEADGGFGLGLGGLQLASGPHGGPGPDAGGRNGEPSPSHPAARPRPRPCRGTGRWLVDGAPTLHDYGWAWRHCVQGPGVTPGPFKGSRTLPRGHRGQLRRGDVQGRMPRDGVGHGPRRVPGGGRAPWGGSGRWRQFQDGGQGWGGARGCAHSRQLLINHVKDFRFLHHGWVSAAWVGEERRVEEGGGRGIEGNKNQSERDKNGWERGWGHREEWRGGGRQPFGCY